MPRSEEQVSWDPRGGVASIGRPIVRGPASPITSQQDHVPEDLPRQQHLSAEVVGGPRRSNRGWKPSVQALEAIADSTAVTTEEIDLMFREDDVLQTAQEYEGSHCNQR